MASNVEIRFPEDQQEGTEATVTAWLVKEGDSVAAHDPVVEIETDKVVVEVAAPEAGVIAHIKIQQDEEVNPGDVLCILDTDAEAGTEPESSSATEVLETESPATETLASNNQADNSRLSPAVRQRVLQHDLDISGIAGSGRDGRITLQDVEALIADQDARQQAAPLTPAAASAAEDLAEGSEIIPHNKMRRRIADSMVDSLMHTAPHVTAVFEADLSAVMLCQSGNATYINGLLYRSHHRGHSKSAQDQQSLV